MILSVLDCGAAVIAGFITGILAIGTAGWPKIRATESLERSRWKTVVFTALLIASACCFRFASFKLAVILS